MGAVKVPVPVRVPDSTRLPSAWSPPSRAVPSVATVRLAAAASTCGASRASVPPALTCSVGDARLPETARMPALTVVAPVKLLAPDSVKVSLPCLTSALAALPLRLPAKAVFTALPVRKVALPRLTLPLPLPAKLPKVSLPCSTRVAALALSPTVTAGAALKVAPPARRVRLPSLTRTVSAAETPPSVLLPVDDRAPLPRRASAWVLPPVKA